MGYRTLTLLALTLPIAGCQLPQLNRGRVMAVTVGAHAGWFRRVEGRWPADFSELVQLDCPRLDEGVADAPDSAAQRTGDDQRCNVLAELPYVVTLRARGQNLRLTVEKSTGTRVCSLTVLAPTPQSARELSPMIRLKLRSFDCPGEGEAL